MSTAAALTLTGFTKRYRTTLAVDGVDLEIARGTTVGLVGPNGAGKSTVLRALCGIVRPTAGTALVLGRPAYALPNPGSALGFVLDTAGLPPWANGLLCLRLEAQAQGLSRADIDTAVQRFGLGDYARRATSRLSTGQRQRLALACATLGDPEVLILDEPTNGLDVEAMVWLRGLIEDRRARGRTTLVSSHALDELRRVVERVVVLDSTVRYDGAYPELEGAAAEEWYLSLVGARPATSGVVA